MLNLLRKLVVTLKYTPNLEESTKYENTSVCASKNVTTIYIQGRPVLLNDLPCCVEDFQRLGSFHYAQQHL